MELISIVVPCYNEEETLPLFYKEILKITQELSTLGLEYEFIFIDDGSKDRTLPILRNLYNQSANVRYISFSRNFGKEAALYAGLEKSKGDYVVVLDADLQDPPSLIPKMYRTLTMNNVDCVATRRTDRKGESVVRSFFSRCFYRIINKLSKVPIVDGVRDFRLMTRQMVDSILSLKEYSRFSKGLFSFVGYNTIYIEFNNVERIAGTTKWSFWNLLFYSIDGIVGFSTVPLSIVAIVGVIFCLVSFIMVFVFVVKTIAFGDPVPGYPSLISIILFLSGIQLFCLGIIGQYLSKTYLEVKKRPIYIIKEEKEGITIGFEGKNKQCL